MVGIEHEYSLKLEKNKRNGPPLHPLSYDNNISLYYIYIKHSE